jgi:hypothetical protein
MLRPVKAATPELAFLVVVPLKTPPPGLDAMATVIAAVEVVTVFPNVSCTETVGGPATELPAVELAGCTVKATFVAVPADTLKLALVAFVSPLEEAVRV